MRTYKYRFASSGYINPDTIEKFTSVVEDNLKNGPNSLLNYCHKQQNVILATKVILDHVDFSMDETAKVSHVNLYTYDYLWKPYKAEITDCLNLALNEAAKETDDKDTYVAANGFMKYVSVDEGIPETLYHITEEKNQKQIMEQGLIPKKGPNDWNTRDKFAFMTEERYIAPWLGILKQIENPVILAVDTKNLTGITQGRTFQDRDYVDGYIYGEYRTKEMIPASAVRRMSLEEIKKTDVSEIAIKQLSHLGSEDDEEIIRCMDRLKQMGVIEKDYEVERDDDFVKAVGNMGMPDGNLNK